MVVVQVWTYTCINWLRTLPYVRAWAEKYRDEGLVVIGVHAPEFSFEKNIDNVRRAAKAMKIDYPIAVDNDYAIWRAFKNQYWPALYFVDAQGRVRHHHFGEGAYQQSEMTIRALLAEGQPPGAAHGIDVDEQGNGTVTEQRLYQLIRQPQPITDRQLEIEFLDSGVEAYAFTFG